MVITNSRDIIQVMVDARKDFESGKVFSCESDLLFRLYSNYSSEIFDVGIFLGNAKNIFPSGCCDLSSIYIRHKLGHGNIVRGSYDRQKHTFLEVTDFNRDELISDITADQFGGPKVYLGFLVHPWSLGYHK